MPGIVEKEQRLIARRLGRFQLFADSDQPFFDVASTGAAQSEDFVKVTRRAKQACQAVHLVLGVVKRPSAVVAGIVARHQPKPNLARLRKRNRSAKRKRQGNNDKPEGPHVRVSSVALTLVPPAGRGSSSASHHYPRLIGSEKPPSAWHHRKIVSPTTRQRCVPSPCGHRARPSPATAPGRPPRHEYRPRRARRSTEKPYRYRPRRKSANTLGVPCCTRIASGRPRENRRRPPPERWRHHACRRSRPEARL